jgi:hypothetical protein
LYLLVGLAMGRDESTLGESNAAERSRKDL